MLRTRNKATPILRPKRNFRATGNRAALWRYWQRWGTRLSADRRSQQLLTRLRARVAAGQELADQFRPTDLEEWFAMSSTTAQDWLHQWQEQGLLEPARPGQRIRSWRLREPWQQWVLGQPQQRE